MRNSLNFFIPLFSCITLVASTQFDKPTLEQLQNTDTVKIYFKCTRDTNATNANPSRWLSIALANDKLIDDCYASTDDTALYERVFDTMRFMLEQSADQADMRVNLMVAGETANKITHHTINGKRYNLVTRLNDKQLAQLADLYQQTRAITYSIAELETLLKHSLYFALVEPSSQQLIGFIRVVTDYVSFAAILDLIIDPEYQSKELKKLLVHTVIHHPKVANILVNSVNQISVNAYSHE
jgi:hypothetical protein